MRLSIDGRIEYGMHLDLVPTAYVDIPRVQEVNDFCVGLSVDELRN